MKKLLIFLTLIMLFLPQGLLAQNTPLVEIRRLQDLVVKILGPPQGSGVFLKEGIVTVAHIVRNRKYLVISVDGQNIIATVVKTNEDMDLALMEVEGEYEYANLRLDPELTENVTIVSALAGFEDVVTFGTIAKILEDVLLIDGKILPGMSGGGVFDEDGRLVGIIWGGHGIASFGDWLPRVTPAEKIKEFLNEKIGDGDGKKKN